MENELEKTPARDGGCASPRSWALPPPLVLFHGITPGILSMAGSIGGGGGRALVSELQAGPFARAEAGSKPHPTLDGRGRWELETRQ